jgi:hypothetical protein
MKNKPVYVCRHCGHIELEDHSWKEKILTVPKVILSAIFLMCALIGMFGLYNFISAGDFSRPELLGHPVGGTWGSLWTMSTNFMSQNESAQLIAFAEPIIKDCADENCKARNLYDYFRTNFKYKVGSDLNPLDIIKEKEGDCDEMSFLYLSTIKALGMDGMMQCVDNHCWDMINVDGKKIYVDIVNDYWIVKNG